MKIKKLSQEEIEERIELLDEAEEKLWEVIDLIRGAVKDTSEEGRAESYILPHLKSWINSSYQIASIKELRENIIRKYEECEEVE